MRQELNLSLQFAMNGLFSVLSCCQCLFSVTEEKPRVTWILISFTGTEN